MTNIVHQAIQLALFLVIFCGPMPFGFATGALAVEYDRPRSNAATLHVFLFCWIIIQACVALLLVAIGALSLNSILAAEVALFVMGCAVTLYGRRRYPGVPTPRRFDFTLESHGLLMLGAIATVGLLQLWVLVTTPITDFDSLSYHMPAMARMVQTGRYTQLAQYDYQTLVQLDLDPLVKVIEGKTGRYPYTWEALSTLLIFPFGDDFLAALPNLMAWAMLGLSVYLLSLYFGASQVPGLTAASIVLLLPLTLASVNTLHVDLPLAAIFASALWYGLQFNRTHSALYLMLFMAGLGLLGAIKFSGLGYGLLTLLTVAALEIRARRRPNSTPWNMPLSRYGPLLFMGAGISILLFLGGYWYLKNWVEVGNPLGIITVQLGNFVFFPGAPLSAQLSKGSLASVFAPLQVAHWKILVTQMAAYLGVPFWALLFPVALAPLIQLGRRVRTFRAADAVLLLLLVGAGLLYWFTPFSASDYGFGWAFTAWMGQGLRYALSFVALLAVLSAVISTRIAMRDDLSVAIVLMLVGIVWGSTGVFQYGLYVIMAAALFVGCVRIAPLANALRTVLQPRLARFGTVVLGVPLLIVLVLVVMTYVRGKRENTRDGSFGGVETYIDHQLAATDTIGYLQSFQSYLFYGRQFDKHVVYVQPAQEARQHWIDSLKSQSVTVLAIGPALVGHIPTQEMEWLNDPRGPFVRVFGTDISTSTLLYRLDY